ncbi:MAG: FAD-binding oxidoreductase [Actinobacteria bacterium]|nr:FAD-binding oxidoreductase [Actinomycetota bacterium]
MGGSGLTAARRLAERGADVVVLDAVGIAAGAAGRNGGFLLAGGARFHHEAVTTWGHELAVGLYRATLDELDRTLDELGDLASRTGSVRIAASEDEERDIERQRRALVTDGFAVEPYDGPEGRGLLVPDDAVFQPVARCRLLARAAVAAGARLHAPARVTGLGDGTVTTSAGDVRADRTLVAVDGGLEQLLPELADDVGTARLQMLATAPDPDLSLPRPVYRRWGYEYVQQLATGEVLLGGCRDRFAADEWDAPAVPSDEVQSCLDAELARLGVAAPVTHRWAAHAAFTQDALPVCREVRHGVLVVGAYSGHGNLVGTLAARVAADTALDGGDLTLDRLVAP